MPDALAKQDADGNVDLVVNGFGDVVTEGCAPQCCDENCFRIYEPCPDQGGSVCGDLKDKIPRIAIECSRGCDDQAIDPAPECGAPGEPDCPVVVVDSVCYSATASTGTRAEIDDAGIPVVDPARIECATGCDDPRCPVGEDVFVIARPCNPNNWQGPGPLPILYACISDVDTCRHWTQSGVCFTITPADAMPPGPAPVGSRVYPSQNWTVGGDCCTCVNAANSQAGFPSPCATVDLGAFGTVGPAPLENCINAPVPDLVCCCGAQYEWVVESAFARSVFVNRIGLRVVETITLEPCPGTALPPCSGVNIQPSSGFCLIEKDVVTEPDGTVSEGRCVNAFVQNPLTISCVALQPIVPATNEYRSYSCVTEDGETKPFRFSRPGSVARGSYSYAISSGCDRVTHAIRLSASEGGEMSTSTYFGVATIVRRQTGTDNIECTGGCAQRVRIGPTPFAPILPGTVLSAQGVTL